MSSCHLHLKTFPATKDSTSIAAMPPSSSRCWGVRKRTPLRWQINGRRLPSEEREMQWYLRWICRYLLGEFQIRKNDFVRRVLKNPDKHTICGREWLERLFRLKENTYRLLTIVAFASHIKNPESRMWNKLCLWHITKPQEYVVV